ncbi:MAG: type II toxin-antitoxin system RelE/ParE family toxin [Candidatus Omnitrophica bacterium]|nr:type II toxin-antitoxin system RelE/ParE family toxin [Candidatus Omnitrophota bacterium]MDD4013235.1 type II toxin-antitoxin system RelE/ParE family toxin [Candidatus Omnitrophota bacterium]
MSRITCCYYLTASGRSPVRDLIDSLAPRAQRKFFFVMELLEEFGSRLPRPHSKYLGKDIFELRFGGEEGAVRVLYFFFQGDTAVFTNGFIKKTGKTPLKELNTAIERRKDFFSRNKG